MRQPTLEPVPGQRHGRRLGGELEIQRFARGLQPPNSQEGDVVLNPGALLDSGEDVRAQLLQVSRTLTQRLAQPLESDVDRLATPLYQPVRIQQYGAARVQLALPILKIRVL